jgi:hypothetical protein
MGSARSAKLAPTLCLVTIKTPNRMLLRFKKKLFFNLKTQVFLSSVFFNNDLKKALLQVLYGTLFFFGMPFLFAQEMDPLLTNDSPQQEAWVQQQLKSMTLDEKIGQLFMVQAYSNKGAAHVKSLLKKIKKYKVGGLIFMQGTPENQARLNNRYQKESKIPLLIGFDGEWGLDMRLKKTFRYPWNMTLGAIQNEHLDQPVWRKTWLALQTHGHSCEFCARSGHQYKSQKPNYWQPLFWRRQVQCQPQSSGFCKRDASTAGVGQCQTFSRSWRHCCGFS